MYFEVYYLCAVYMTSQPRLLSCHVDITQDYGVICSCLVIIDITEDLSHNYPYINPDKLHG